MVALDVAAIQNQLGFLGLELFAFDEIQSTNTCLLDREFGDQPAPPRLAIAARQAAGRG